MLCYIGKYGSHDGLLKSYLQCDGRHHPGCASRVTLAVRADAGDVGNTCTEERERSITPL